MAGAIGATSKARTGSGTNVVINLGTTVTGSTIVADFGWSGGAFSSIVDSKGNSYSLVDSQVAVGSADAHRRYECVNATGGASHTITFTIASTGAITGLGVELQGVVTVSARDQSADRADTASPFTLAAGLTTTQADEILVAGIFGNSGSNPATNAETGIGGMTIQTLAQELDGSSFFAGCIATKIVSATGTFNPSFTQTGATGASVHLSTYKVAAAGGTIFNRNPLSSPVFQSRVLQ
jgi:hypothetical protein